MEKMVFTNLTREDFHAIIIDAVNACLKHHSAQPPRHPDTVPGQAAPPYVSKKEAGRLLGVCVSSVDNAARAGKLKRHYVGKSVRFDRSEVLALAKAHTNHKQTT